MAEITANDETGFVLGEVCGTLHTGVLFIQVSAQLSFLCFLCSRTLNVGRSTEDLLSTVHFF